MKTLLIEPVDVWMFRDGKPFDAGSTHRAESVFPPLPSTIQGVLRSHQLILANVDLRDRAAVAACVGDADNMRGLKLRGPFVARRAGSGAAPEIYLPVPANAAASPDGWVALRPKPWPAGVRTSSPLPEALWPVTAPGKYPELGEWLSLAEWGAFWAGQPVRGIPGPTLFVRETRTGIELGAQRTAKTGQLYEAEFIRPGPGVGLLVEMDGYDHWPSQGLLRIGGEARAASYTTTPSPAWPAAPAPLPARFAVCLTTPALFEGGWQPAGGWSKFFDGPVQLVCAAFGRPHSLGGFDFAKAARNPADPAAHKPARRYVPAGAVYFFVNQGAKALTAAALTDHGADFGFGRFLVQEQKTS